MKSNIKIICLIILNCVFSFILGQNKKIVIIDSITYRPVNLAQIYYPSILIGGVTNEDGKAIIPIREEKIKISHINYATKNIDYKEFIKSDTICLNPIQHILDEIIVYNFDLKKKLSEVFKEYTDNYSSKNIISHSTYKETYEVNDSLVRLFQIQLDWWSKNYIFDFNNKVERFNKIKINNIDYSKVSKESSFTPKAGFIENKDFLKFCHLNFLLSIIRYNTEELVINSVDINGNFVEVNFDGKVIERKKTIYSFKNSKIVFKANKIYHIILNMDYSNDIGHTSVSKEWKMPYITKNYSHRVELSFRKNFLNKLFLGFFSSDLKGAVKINNNLNNLRISPKLLINKTVIGKKLKGNIIDLNNPFYENLKEKKKSNDTKFLLTQKETDFINE